MRTTARSASLQVVAGAYKLVLARIVPLRCRLGLYRSYLNGLDDTAFDIYGTRIIPALSFSKRTSSIFRNEEQEFRTVLRWFPRLAKFRGVLREHISAERKKYGLKC